MIKLHKQSGSQPGLQLGGRAIFISLLNNIYAITVHKTVFGVRQLSFRKYPKDIAKWERAIMEWSKRNWRSNRSLTGIDKIHLIRAVRSALCLDMFLPKTIKEKVCSLSFLKNNIADVLETTIREEDILYTFEPAATDNNGALI